MRSAAYSAEQVAELLAVSKWAIYQAARRGEPPIGNLAIRVGRRLVWPRAAIDDLLGLRTDRPSPHGTASLVRFALDGAEDGNGRRARCEGSTVVAPQGGGGGC
jgi:predicted DNA-binding transcriptional regulator AlpA